MAGSQLKRLKSSLRDQGIIGPQKSKKQKKKAALDARANGTQDKRLKRSEALNNIREQFNPFQFKMNARGPKFPVTSLRKETDGLRGIKGRPAEALSRSEQKRRETLLVDMQHRNKVGGFLDRRLGEGDANMTPEERMMERFAFESQRRHREKAHMFDLNDDDDEGAFFGGLTHDGKALGFDETRDDFEEDDLEGDSDGNDEDEDEDGDASRKKKLKRLRSELNVDEDGNALGGEDDDAPGRKKTKKEVMHELITKSKYHKYERQLAREADDEEREALDKMLPEVQELLFSSKAVKEHLAHKGDKTDKMEKVEKPDGKSGQNGLVVDTAALEKAYDMRLRKMVNDKRAEPTQRTKTEEERAEEQSAHLKKLEEDRLKRMRGENTFEEADKEDEDDKSKNKKNKKGDEPVDDRPFSFPQQEADEDAFGLGSGIKVRHTAAELGFDDEDDFLIDDDLVASGSEVEPDEEDSEDEGSELDDSEFGLGSDGGAEDEEFLRAMTRTEKEEEDLSKSASSRIAKDDDGVPYTFPCPQSHEEFLAILQDVPTDKLITVVQRIRALYHPKLDHGNKERLGQFAGVLLDHVAYLGNGGAADYRMIESLGRHIHSLAKTVPIDVANAFRKHLGTVSEERPLALQGGDLAVLTITTLFPTSDHFHQVVTPAMLVMGRYLEQKTPRKLADWATGLFASTLFLQYQQQAQRYVPELVTFVLSAVLALGPEALPRSEEKQLGFVVHKSGSGSLRIQNAKKTTVRKLRPSDCIASEEKTEKNERSEEEEEEGEKKVALLQTAISLLDEAVRLWADKAALWETLVPVDVVVRHLQSSSLRSHLPKTVRSSVKQLAERIQAAQKQATQVRRPLELHHHRPQPIRTYVPRFEDGFDPDKHYDADQERAEANKLRAEHRRERKSAIRELRKDAQFMQREQLRAKKAADAAYEKKYKRLVAEIQGEEGHAANEYERERQRRQRKR